jgi:EmrB/QacA subfamily drug resistance transporter
MAIMGVPMMLGPIAGPILGGWLVDDFSWRWIFFINVPVGIVALALTVRVLPRDVPQPGHRLDWLGLGLLSPGLALLIYGLAKTSTEGGFGSAAVLVPMALGVVALAAFVAHAKHAGEDALIDLRLFANKTFSAAAGTMILVIIAVFGGMLLLPLYLQTVRGESAMDSGLLLAPQGIGAMLAMPIAGNLADRTGIGRIVPGGLVLVGVTFLGLTQLEADTSYWLFGVDLFFMGIGMGMTMMPTFSGAMQTLSQAAIPKASTTLNINQQVGASIGTAVLSVLLAHQLEGAASPTAQADAYGSTFVWAFVLVAVAFVVALVLLPKEKPAAPADPGAAAHMMA